MQVTYILAAAAARPWILINVRRASVSVVVVLPIVSREYVPVIILFSSSLSENCRTLSSLTPFPPSWFASRHRCTTALHYTSNVWSSSSPYVFKWQRYYNLGPKTLRKCNTYPMYYIYFFLFPNWTRATAWFSLVITFGFFSRRSCSSYLGIYICHIIYYYLSPTSFFIISVSSPPHPRQWRRRTKPRWKRKRLLRTPTPHARLRYRVYGYFFPDHFFLFFFGLHIRHLLRKTTPVIYIIIIYCTHSGKTFFFAFK